MLDMAAILILVVLLPTQSSPLPTLAALFILLPGVWAAYHGAPFVPTPQRTVRQMMAFADIRPGDEVHDLGCGDGRLIFAAARKGAKAIGYELSLPVYLIAKVQSWFRPGSKVFYRNFWSQKYKNADVVFCYLLTSTMQTFEKKIWPQLKPGCKVISHSFRMKGVKEKESKNGVVLYVK